MQRVSLDDVEPDRLGDGVDRHALSGRLGTTDVAVNRYRVAPGEGLPGGLHAHGDQEEVFVVLHGEATFEVLPPTGEEARGSVEGGDGEGGGGDTGSGSGANAGSRQSEARTVTVAAGEAVRFAPGEFQTGRNGADDWLVVLALGAPRDTEDVRIPVACPECGHGDVRLDAGGDGVEFVCPDCGATHVPLPCPDCGSDDLRVVPGEATRTVVVCGDCGLQSDEPPLAT